MLRASDLFDVRVRLALPALAIISETTALALATSSLGLAWHHTWKKDRMLQSPSLNAAGLVDRGVQDFG